MSTSLFVDNKFNLINQETMSPSINEIETYEPQICALPSFLEIDLLIQ